MTLKPSSGYTKKEIEMTTPQVEKKARRRKGFLITMLVAVPLCAPDLQAGERNPHRLTCNNRTLEGAYAVSITGTRPAPVILPIFQGVPVGTIEQVTGVFILVFDGDGEVTLTNHVTVKGALSGLFPVFPENPTSGTYTINEDCTGSFTGAPPAPMLNNFMISSGGDEFHTIVVAPQQVMISGVGKKVNQEDSSRYSR
jgi:hypothetical protein